MEAARLFSYVWFVMGPNLGITLFSLLNPLIPATSTRFVTKVENGICLFSIGDLIQKLDFFLAWQLFFSLRPNHIVNDFVH